MIKLQFLTEDFSKEEKIFQGIAQDWQSEYSYQGVNLEKWKKMFHLLPKATQKYIQVKSLRGLWHSSQMELEDILDNKPISIVSFSNKKTAEFFKRQRGGTFIFDGTKVKKFSLAFSFEKMAI